MKKSKSIDEHCNLSPGSFNKFLKNQELDNIMYNNKFGIYIGKSNEVYSFGQTFNIIESNKYKNHYWVFFHGMLGSDLLDKKDCYFGF